MLFRSQQAKSHIDSIQDPAGECIHGLDSMTDVFKDFFFSRISTRLRLPQQREELQFLDQCPLPTLSPTARRALSTDIKLEELTEAVMAMANGKSPGTDGLPAEIYKRYSKPTLPVLLKTLTEALKGGSLPHSMKRLSW